jgi:hypothetical protein
MRPRNPLRRHDALNLSGGSRRGRMRAGTTPAPPPQPFDGDDISRRGGGLRAATGPVARMPARTVSPDRLLRLGQSCQAVPTLPKTMRPR